MRGPDKIARLSTREACRSCSSRRSIAVHFLRSAYPLNAEVIAVSIRSNTSVAIDASMLASGAYIYGVVAEGAARTYSEAGSMTLLK